MPATRPVAPFLAIALALGLAGLAALAQQAPPATTDAARSPEAAARSAPSESPTATPAAKAPTAPAGSEAATPAKPAAAKGSPQRFEPTEKVRPDFDVAFPVDI
jgi:hypothetical protein